MKARGRVYIEAFKRSDFTAMLNYYRANYPRPDQPTPASPPTALPKVTVPVLMFHGLADQALLPGALSGTWEWLQQDLTLVTIPGAGHFVQQDAADLVTNTMLDWLARRVPSS
jgi:pimeloyl-ACP methyl ester carboxylesterase